MRIPPMRPAAKPRRCWRGWQRTCGGCAVSPLFVEYVAICNWLGESDGIVDFMDMANDYRARIGVDRSPENGEAYLRALIDLAKQTFGAA